MRPTTTFVRTLTAAERQQLQAGLRAADAFTVRRCQILLASAHGQRAPTIARNLHCAVGTVHYALRAFGREGLACLQEKSSRPHSAQGFLVEPPETAGVARLDGGRTVAAAPAGGGPSRPRSQGAGLLRPAARRHRPDAAALRGGATGQPSD